MPTLSALPIFDLHCDLLSYLVAAPSGHPTRKEDIGCAVPHLQAGRVRLQVLAIYAPTERGSSDFALRQSQWFEQLLRDFPYAFCPARFCDELDALASGERTGIVAAVENASGFCEEDERLEDGFVKLEKLVENTGRLLYIGLTHHGQNRFGGGNQTPGVGLKADGRALLNYLSGRQIALDLAHASDALAYEALDHISRFGLDIPVLASHSNFRSVYDHPRNLPDDIAREIMARQGLIGINFLRAYVHDKQPQHLLEHLHHGFAHGAQQALAFGADFFYTGLHPDPSREPFYFAEHANASRYPHIMEGLYRLLSDQEHLRNLAYGNVQRFLQRLWA